MGEWSVVGGRGEEGVGERLSGIVVGRGAEVERRGCGGEWGVLLLQASRGGILSSDGGLVGCASLRRGE